MTTLPAANLARGGRYDDSMRTSPRLRPSWRAGVPLVALVFSGGAGLTYEVVWSRAMAALFGSVVTATGMLLALFMGGLALGAAVGARWAARLRRPLLGFGIIETVVGLLALGTPILLRHAAPLVVRLDAGLPDALAPLVPAAASVVILGPIVVLMGATFPLFVAHASGGPDRAGADSGLVYGLNTIGAVGGTLAGGFLLLPALGIQRTLWLAAGVDLAVGLVCIALGIRFATGAQQPPARREWVEGSTPRRRAGAVEAVVLAGGAASLILEVAWFRGLMLIFGSSVYALSMMLAAFLLGMGGGALALRRRVDRASEPWRVLGEYHLLIGFTATMATVILQVLPALFIPVLSWSRGSFGVVSGGSLAILVVFMLVPTALMGASLPAGIRVAAAGHRGDVAGTAGALYAVSSVGACLGSLAAGFVLVPRLGLRGSVAVAVGLSLAAGALALARAGAPARRLGFQVVALTGVVWAIWFAGMLPWDWRVLTGGYYAYGHLYSRDQAVVVGPTRREVFLQDEVLLVPPEVRPQPFGRRGRDREAPEQLLMWEEGSYAQVAVVEQDGVRSLLINGKADASTGLGDMRTQLLLGHLPVLLAPAPAAGDAMVIGLGSGVTAGAVASWPFSAITVAEIEPAVVRASSLFATQNRRALEDPRVQLRLDDGRRVLARRREPLALLTSEPSNLWMSGVSLLFTREFFAQAADRLGESGVMCQWLHLYQAGPDDVRTLLATMATAFPHLVAFADGTDLLVVASRSPLVLDPYEWQRRLQGMVEVQEMLAASGIRSARDIAGGLVADERGIRDWSDGAPLHTDDRPRLEFSAARRMASDYSAAILAELVASGEAAGPIPLGEHGRVGPAARHRR